MAPGEGNTRPPPPIKKRGNSAKNWCFTLNNWTEDELAPMAPKLDRLEMDYVIGKEAGEEGTPHLQGAVFAKEKFRPMEKLGFTPRIHWESCKGNIQQNVTYCIKGGDYITNIKIPRTLTFPEFNKPWQLMVLEILKTAPDDRTIHWFHGPANIGKTTFTKYLVSKLGAVMVAGKGADVRNAICTYLKDTGTFPEIVVFPIPRSFNADYLSYEALENIKDMCFYSGKYEGGQVCGPCPHLLVFSNEQPDYGRMSADRWAVHQID